MTTYQDKLAKLDEIQRMPKADRTQAFTELAVLADTFRDVHLPSRNNFQSGDLHWKAEDMFKTLMALSDPRLPYAVRDELLSKLDDRLETARLLYGSGSRGWRLR